MSITVRQTDLSSEEDRALFVHLLNEYAEDPYGGGESLPDATKATLGTALRDFPTAFVFLAYYSASEGDVPMPCGVCTAIEGFSTFAAKPLMNFHDVAVLKEYRGKGVGTKMLEAVEALAKQRGCCKLTLEVLSGNEPAKRVYSRYGFEPYELDPEAGHAMFWQKKI
jgi:GNAT superfamily N-acetyltransferase